LLEKEELIMDPKNRELLENIQTEGDKLSHLVQNLLEATRLESGSVRLSKEMVPFEEVVESVLGRLDKPLRGRQVKVDIPENLPLVPMDATLVEQVLVNLLENANRHTPRESVIEVSAAVEAGSLVVSVADRGPGLKQEDLERVFEKFYHDPSSPGSGLGLAICRAIVKVHGGSILAANRKGGGAVFTFSLPLGEVHGS